MPNFRMRVVRSGCFLFVCFPLPKLSMALVPAVKGADSVAKPLISNRAFNPASYFTGSQLVAKRPDVLEAWLKKSVSPSC
jgi:hypothetical protein